MLPSVCFPVSQPLCFLGLWVSLLLMSCTNVLLLPEKLFVVVTCCLPSEITLMPFIYPVDQRIEVLLLTQ